MAPSDGTFFGTGKSPSPVTSSKAADSDPSKKLWISAAPCGPSQERFSSMSASRIMSSENWGDPPLRSIAPSTSFGVLSSTRGVSASVSLSTPLPWGGVTSPPSSLGASAKSPSSTSSCQDSSISASAGSEGPCITTHAHTQATSFNCSSSSSSSSSPSSNSSLSQQIESEDRALVLSLGLRDLFFSFF
ncbi:PREDICTED: putative protein TPRXL [Nicotiana attenuata]|uniref:putative protein TPRXL n=1 Tax=Nicotiana attenuata TaxID=49451 RepID=UPI0009050AC4|nr:PREDICTED: putative protein TPRXL [Nicotiana attenuata]